MLILRPPDATPDGLFERLAGLRRRLRIIDVLRGGCTLLAVLVGAVALIVWLDWKLHLPGLVRAAALVSLLVGGSLLLIHGLVRPLRRPADNLALALRIEARFPDLNDSLASTVQFLDPPGGSAPMGAPLLRRAAVTRALAESEGYDFGRVIDNRPMWRAGIALAAVVAVAVPLFAGSPARTQTALVRLADPFGAHDWPAQTTVEILAPRPLPTRMARGEPFELRVRIAGVIPDRATFWIKVEGTGPSEQAVVVPAPKAGEGFSDLTVRLEPSRVARSFQFRLQANDADTGVQTVEVSPPPVLVPLDGRPSPQFRLDYPAYTGLPPRDLPDGGSLVEALAGTRLTLRAATDRPVVAAGIAYRPEQLRLNVASYLATLGAAHPADALSLAATGREDWPEVPATISGGTRLEVSFVPRVSGVYALRFADDTGLAGTRLLDVRVPTDPAPLVALDRPSATQDGLALLPDAEFTVQARADDPTFAVRSFALEYRTAPNGPVRRMTLYEPDAFGAAVPMLLNGFAGQPLRMPDAPWTLRPQRLAHSGRLAVTAFTHPDGKPLREGDVLILQAAADDFDDVSAFKAPGRSPEIELRIVSPATLETAIQQLQANIRKELLGVRDQQREATQKAAEVTPQPATGRLKPEDVDRVLQAEQTQQQVRNRIGTKPEEGLRAEAARLRQMLQDNNLPRSATHDRVEALDAELDRLGREDLEPIEPLLAASRRENDADGNGPRKDNPLAEAQRLQRQAEQAMTALLERLEPWSGANEVRGEARSLLSEQRRVEEQTGRLTESVPRGTEPDRLTPEQRAELDRAAARQERLGEQSQQLLDKLGRLADQKEKAAHERLELADQKEKEAKKKDAEAANAAPGSEAQRRALDQAAGLRAEAQDLRESAESMKEEAAAIQKAAEAGRMAELPRQARDAARQVRQNQPGEAARNQADAARTLEQMIQSLEEQAEADRDRVARQRREAERLLDELIEQQERLRKKAEEAAKIADPAKRKQALERLAEEEEQLRQKARELSQRLTRQRADRAADAVSRAARQMDTARQQLEQGDPSGDVQDDVLDRLDQAQAELEARAEQQDEELIREKLAKLAELVGSLKERQQAANAEADRVHATVMKAGKWERPMAFSLRDLRDRQKAIGTETGRLAEKRFRNYRVFDRLLKQATEAMEAATELTGVRFEDVKLAQAFDDDDRAAEESAQKAIRREQDTALRRLTQLQDVLKTESLARAQLRQPPPQAGGPMPMTPPMAGSRPPGDDLPPLAQLKAVRALQAEINGRTAEFAKIRPDPAKYTEDDEAELQAIRKLQADVAELIEEMTPPADGGGGQP